MEHDESAMVGDSEDQSKARNPYQLLFHRQRVMLQLYFSLATYQRMKGPELGRIAVNLFSFSASHMMAKVGWGHDQVERHDKVLGNVTSYFHTLTTKLYPDEPAFARMSIIDMVYLTFAQNKLVFQQQLSSRRPWAFSNAFSETYGPCLEKAFQPRMVFKVTSEGKTCEEVFSQDCRNFCTLMSSIKRLVGSGKFDEVKLAFLERNTHWGQR